MSPEPGKYEQPRCYGCQQKIKFKKGDKTRLNLDGTVHHCPPKDISEEDNFSPDSDTQIAPLQKGGGPQPVDEADFSPQDGEISKSTCKDCKQPVFFVFGDPDGTLYAEYDCKKQHSCLFSDYQTAKKKTEITPSFQTGDKVPVRPTIRITKIIVSRTLSINYGVATQFSTEKEAILNSMTIGYESETSANFEQAELVTHDLMNQINYAIKTEFSDKYKLRMLTKPGSQKNE